MLTEQEKTLFQENIDAYKRMIRYYKVQMLVLQRKMEEGERCCFDDKDSKRTRLPIAK